MFQSWSKKYIENLKLNIVYKSDKNAVFVLQCKNGLSYYLNCTQHEIGVKLPINSLIKAENM